MLEEYKRRLSQLTTLDALDAFMEFIADAEDITTAEYCELYEIALNKARSWIFR